MKRTPPLRCLLPFLALAASLQLTLGYYDPGIQRWINRDPIEERGGMNLYRFVGNGPLNWYDANGLEKSTVQCDGNGHYEFVLSEKDKNSRTRACIVQHEEDHITDYKKRYGENSCQGKKRGDIPAGDLPGEAPGGYDRFLNQSECDAYKKEVECDEKLLSSCPPKDKPAIEIDRNSDRRQRDFYCDKAKKAKAK